MPGNRRTMARSSGLQHERERPRLIRTPGSIAGLRSAKLLKRAATWRMEVYVMRGGCPIGRGASGSLRPRTLLPRVVGPAMDGRAKYRMADGPCSGTLVNCEDTGSSAHMRVKRIVRARACRRQMPSAGCHRVKSADLRKQATRLQWSAGC